MHHANAYIGSEEWALRQLPFDVTVTGPDVIVSRYERFGIDDVRALTLEVSRMPSTEGAVRHFVLILHVIPKEAQNALLKLVEEPNPNTILYFILPRENICIPTLKSRLAIIDVESNRRTFSDFESFRQMTYTERFEVIALKIKSDDQEWARGIYGGFVHMVRSENMSALFSDALLISTYRHAHGHSDKMLLEYLALSF